MMADSLYSDDCTANSQGLMAYYMGMIFTGASIITAEEETIAMIQDRIQAIMLLALTHPPKKSFKERVTRVAKANRKPKSIPVCLQMI